MKLIPSLLVVLLVPACAAPTSPSASNPQEVTIDPSPAKVGQDFTVKLERKPLASMQLSDGTYKLTLEKWTPPVTSIWDFLKPAPAAVPVPPVRPALGEVVVNDGVGTSSFTLKTDYGSGVTPEPGTLLVLDFEGPNEGFNAVLPIQN